MVDETEAGAEHKTAFLNTYWNFPDRHLLFFYFNCEFVMLKYLCIYTPLFIKSIATIPQYIKLATKKTVPNTVTISGSFLFVYMRNSPIEM